MKKTLLTLAAALLFGTAQSEAKVSLQDYTPVATKNVLAGQRAPMQIEKQAKKDGIRRAATADGYDIDFCGDIQSWYYAAQKNNTTYVCYTYIPAEIATSLAGNQITEITFSVALNKSTDTRTGSVFVSEDINAEPITSTPVTVIDSYEASETYDQTQALETPYTIKEGTGFFFGYIVEKCKYVSLTNQVDYPIGVGDGAANRFAGYVTIFDKDGKPIGELDMAQDTGMNLYLKATTVGEKKSVENVFTVKGGYIDTFTMPVTKDLTNKTAKVIIENIGTNDLTTIKYQAMVVDGETIENTLDINVAGGETKAVALPVPDYVIGKSLVYVLINSINGVTSGSEVLLPFIGLDNDGYDRKFLVEEGTGTWCGWCPRGIVGFEYMEKTYPDKFVGIAGHDGDNMYVESYEPLFTYYVDGFPSCIINRDPYFIDDPSAEALDYYINLWDTQLGAAKIDFTGIKVEGNSIKVSTSSKFAYNDPNSKVYIATAILENDIPDIQTNYYAGGQYGECGGWESYPKEQPWLYKHVARDIDDYFGVEGSLPTQVAKDVEYKYTSEISLDNVTNVENTAIVVILQDMWSGTVLNAAKISAADYDKLSGINDIITPAEDAPVEYYNLQGVRMQPSDMPAGIYLKRQGASTTKAIIR